MAQNHAAPAPPRVLAVVRDGTAVPEPGPATVPVLSTGTGTGASPVPVPAEVVPLTVPERTRLAVARWGGTAAGIAGRIWAPSGRALHSLLHPEPETMAEHRAYIRSLAWVPAELRGRKSATAIAVLGFIYHALIGHPLKASMKAVVKTAQNIDQAAERPLRIFMFAAFISALVLILLNL